MAGVSLAVPARRARRHLWQPGLPDAISRDAIHASAAWVEGYPTVSNDGSLGGSPFSVTSRTQGFAAPEIGVIQDLRSVGVPGAVGLGFGGLSGLGAEYRSTATPPYQRQQRIRGSRRERRRGRGDQRTPLAGAALTLGNAFEQLGFTGPLVQQCHGERLWIARNFRSRLRLQFLQHRGRVLSDQARLRVSQCRSASAPTYHDLLVSQPETIGLGWANRSLMDGNLLIAADVYYKLWEDAPLWQDVLHQPMGVRRRCPAHPGKDEVPPRLLLQQRSAKPLCGKQFGRIPRGPGGGPAIPGGKHSHDQPAPDYRRHRPARVPGAHARLGPVRRRPIERAATSSVPPRHRLPCTTSARDSPGAMAIVRLRRNRQGWP